MKKVFLLTFVLAITLVVSGCGDKQEQAKQKVQEKISEQVQKGGGMLNSIGDAMGLGKKMKCTFKMKIEGQKEMEYVTYVDGDKYRSESMMMGKKYISIYDGKAMHSWNEGEKKGFKMTKECMDEMGKQAQGEEENQEEDVILEEEMKMGAEAFDNAMDVDCQPTSSIDFSVPADIVFADQCEMMRQMQSQTEDMMKKFQENMPEGMPSMEGMPEMP